MRNCPTLSKDISVKRLLKKIEISPYLEPKTFRKSKVLVPLRPGNLTQPFVDEKNLKDGIKTS